MMISNMIFAVGGKHTSLYCNFSFHKEGQVFPARISIVLRVLGAAGAARGKNTLALHFEQFQTAWSKPIGSEVPREGAQMDKDTNTHRDRQIINSKLWSLERGRRTIHSTRLPLEIGQRMRDPLLCSK